MDEEIFQLVCCPRIYAEERVQLIMPAERSSKGGRTSPRVIMSSGPSCVLFSPRGWWPKSPALGLGVRGPEITKM